MNGSDSDWQSSKKKVNERTAHLLKTDQWSDCSFLVGSEPNQKLFNAHKIILAMSSPVFQAMFYGGISQQEPPIPILDVQPEAFGALLEYVYTDEVNITSFDQACEVCYVAKKYMLPHLVEQCTKLVFRDLSPSNACKAYEFAKLFEEHVLMDKSLNIICNETEAAITDPSFEDVELSTLLMILDCPQLNVSSERSLFNAVLRWALRECARKGVPNDLNGLRSVIGPALTKIHFLTLTPKQFADGPCQAGLLTQDESFAILMNISSPGTGVPLPEGFSTVAEPRPRFPVMQLPENDDGIVREGHKFFCIRHLFALVPYPNTGILDCNLSFTVDRNVCILGIQLPSQLKPSPQTLPRPGPFRQSLNDPPSHPYPSNTYNELIYGHLLDADNSRLTYTHFTSRVEYGGKLFDIYFNRSVYIQRNKVYKIVVVTNKPGSYLLATDRTPSCHYNSVTFNFLETESEKSEANQPLKDTLVRSIIFSY